MIPLERLAIVRCPIFPGNGIKPMETCSSSRRGFLAAGAGFALLGPGKSGARGQSSSGPLIEEQDLASLRLAMESGKATSRTLVQAYLARMEAIDRAGPALNSVIELNPDALAIAGDLDRERQAQGPRGPLHGIPVLIKDNIATADKMATTAGSLALVGARPVRDAFLVNRLRKAGAVILGKTNLSEWANFRGSNSTSGWSGRGGLTKNPYALDRNTSGSSSGSAAAVAASLCAAAVGTETDGSILSPSAVNGIVGLKPTVGLISRSGVIPISRSQDTAGPMSRTVRDAAILLSGLVGDDPQDRPDLSRTRPEDDSLDYTRNLLEDGLRGARIGVARNYAPSGSKVDTVLALALNTLKKQGAILVETAELPHGGQYAEAELTVFYYEMKAGLNAYLASLGPNALVQNVGEVIAFNKKNAASELQHFGQDHLEKVASMGGLDSPEYQKALALCRRVTRAEGIDAVMDKLKLDAIVGPCGGPAWLTRLKGGDNTSWGGYDLIGLAAVAGYPSIAVPTGSVGGLPVAVAFAGRAWSERTLLKIAYGFEQAIRARRPPKYLATVNP